MMAGRRIRTGSWPAAAWYFVCSFCGARGQTAGGGRWDCPECGKPIYPQER